VRVMRGSRRFARNALRTRPVHTTFLKPTLMLNDVGRHIAMLPSRGLRPAQFAPLASRQSTVLRSNATRKVRIPTNLATHLIEFTHSRSHTQAAQLPFHEDSTTAVLRLKTGFFYVLIAAVLLPSPNCQPLRPIMSGEPAPVGAVEVGREPDS
jgi:hypothetical protein